MFGLELVGVGCGTIIKRVLLELINFVNDLMDDDEGSDIFNQEHGITVALSLKT